MDSPFDALLLVSFGGPEGPDDVLPFLENVLRGRNVPRERMLEVAGHYRQFGGVSPINAQNRALLAAVRHELAAHHIDLPVYWGNRNWHPLLPDTLRKMQQQGVKHALALVTSAFSSFSGCRQYLDNIEAARAEVGPGAPEVHKLRAFFNHPGFIEPMVARVREALAQFAPAHCENLQVLFTAHSIPLAMAQTCDYVAQLEEASRLVAEGVGIADWRLVYQSRSGPPSQPWLEPDVCQVLREIAKVSPGAGVLLAPIGFISDHMEVKYDLDVEARQLADELALNMVRAGTVGTHPRFVQMVRELIEERMAGAPRLALGTLGPSHDVCPEGCCRYTAQRPPAR